MDLTHELPPKLKAAAKQTWNFKKLRMKANKLRREKESH